MNFRWVDPRDLFFVFWGCWTVSWLLAAFWRSPATRRLSTAPVWLYRALLGAGVLLLVYPMRARGLWPVGLGAAYVLAFLTLPGFALTWWARLHLGKLWSSAVTRKQDHRIVDTGPYAVVRHPIYTGLLFAALVSAIASATWPALLGFTCMLAGLLVKARLEEKLLAEELGPETYAGYRARVPMLVPGWRV